MASTKSGPGKSTVGVGQQEIEESLWDVNFDKADLRIHARRNRIKNRIDAARKVKTIVQVGQMFGYHRATQLDTFPVQEQCEKSKMFMDAVIDNGTELVTNVRLAADHLQVQHRNRIENLEDAMQTLLEKEERETREEMENIASNWPKEGFKKAPTALYEKIITQKNSCNELLRKRNELIAVLEREVRDSDNQYKTLVEEFHENTSVLGSRMEHQIQALERLIKSERGKLNEAFVTQKKEHLKKNDHSWQVKLETVSRTSEEQMEQRLKLLNEQEKELDELIVMDAEAFIDMKNEMESNIAVLSDQIQFLEAIHQLNEERLDYEIHVLKKHEEEVVLVKSEQKRKITVLQDTINKLRQKVRTQNDEITKEENHLHDIINDIRQQLENLHKKKRAYGSFTSKKREEIANMVREEIKEQVGRISEADLTLQIQYMAQKPRKIDIYGDKQFQLELESVQKEKFGKRLMSTTGRQSIKPGPSDKLNTNNGVQHQSSFDEDKSKGSGASGNAAGDRKTKREGDTTMKEMLSTLVQEANFLVEDNLNLLVEDDEFNEAERTLFKLDSILTAIGVEGEEEVMNVLKKHEASQSSSLDGVRDSIMKIIRAHIEQNRRRISGTGDMLLTDEKRTSKLYRASEAHISVKSGDIETIEKTEWSMLHDKIQQFQSTDRLHLLDILKSYHQVLNERSTLLSSNLKMKMLNEELRMLLRRSTA